jgi:hypothetical protein
MAAAKLLDPLAMLVRRMDRQKLVTFFTAVNESFPAAFADSARNIPARPNQRAAIHARGNLRHSKLEEMFRSAAKKAQLPIITGYTNPPSWSFPIIRAGAFSITLGIADRRFVPGRRRLRSRGRYMQRHCERNNILDPQSRLIFAKERDVVRKIIPDGSIGALITVEGSIHTPNLPRYIGFWVMAPGLRRTFFDVPIEDLIAFLRKSTSEKSDRRPINEIRRRPKLLPRKDLSDPD